MADIPEGYGIIAGRGRDTAIKALAAAKVAGVDSRLVKTVDEGYLVPIAVLDAFDESNESAPEAEDVQNLNADAEEEEIAYPARNASKAAWQKWAVDTQGYDADEGLTRDELIERYGEKE